MGEFTDMRPMRNIWKGKTVFITGANGFLGTQLTRRALSKKAKVIVLIKENIANSHFHREKLSRKVKVVQGSLDDPRLIHSIFKANRIDLCFHVGAQAIVSIANRSPIETFRSNIEGTWNILEASRRYGVGALIVASSDKAYGDQEKLPYTEDSPLLALHPYDASKACADILSRTYARTYDLPVAVTRCANIYGPGDVNFSRIIPDTIRSVVHDKDPIIRSDGTPLRDYVFVEDIVDAYFILAEKIYLKKIQVGHAFNFGTARPISVLNLVKEIIRVSGKTHLRPIVLGKSRLKGEIQKQYLSSRRAKSLLGWKPKYTLKKGLRNTYQWNLNANLTFPKD